MIGVVSVFLLQGNKNKFNANLWQDEKLVNEKPYIRLGMVDDLMNNYLTKGMTKEKIIEILGMPDKKSSFDESDFVYWLGPEHGLISIDSKWLVLKMDNAFLLKEYSIITD